VERPSPLLDGWLMADGPALLSLGPWAALDPVEALEIMPWATPSAMTHGQLRADLERGG
jgi:hypothetical protein